MTSNGMANKPRKRVPRGVRGTTADIAFINDDNERSTPIIERLLQLPTHEWRHAFAERPEWITLATLRAALAHAHEELDRNPLNARRIARIVLTFIHRLSAPTDSAILFTALLGDAWKEYGNALRSTGRLEHARKAAVRAIAIFASDDALIVQYAAALVLKAHVEHDFGRHDDAERLLTESAAIFSRCSEQRRYLQTMTLRGIFLYEQSHYTAAADVFSTARVIAEELGDSKELARVLNNLGHCKLQLGRTLEAWDLLVRAAALYSQEGMLAELPRAEWGLARLLQCRANGEEAVQDLRRIHDTFALRGMIVEAATALLEIIGILATDPTQKLLVRSLCRDIAELYRNTRMPPAAVAALAQLKDDAILGDPDVAHVRNYFRRLRENTATIFVPGH